MARTNNLTNFLTDVASAIKDKKGNQADIQASDFDTEIRNLPSQGTYQQKSTTITQNGTMTVIPDAGYDAIDELTINTNIPLQTRSYTFTQNTTITLTPEQGYAGFDEVGITVNIPSGTDINLFVQSAQPSGYNGIWIQTNEVYNNVVEVSDRYSTVASSINIVKGNTLETILFDSDVQNGLHYKFGTVVITDANNNIKENMTIYYGDGSQWIDMIPYIKLEYIQSTGTQYINTEIKGNLSTDIEAKFICTATSPNYMRIYGNETSSNYSMYMNNTTRTSWGFNEGSSYITMDFTSSGTVKFIGSNAQVYYNGTLQGTVKATSNTNKNIWLFRGGDRYSNFRMQRCKLWDNNVLVRDLIPVRRKSDSTICMYDLITNSFYTNAGTGVFTAGPVVS